MYYNVYTHTLTHSHSLTHTHTLTHTHSHSDIEVLYGGDDIFDYELNQAKLHDIKLAAISGGVILITMLILTGFSPSLTLWGALAIVMCYIVALAFYRLVLHFETFSLLTIVTTFVIIGIGVDDVFVFLNTFKQSKDLEGLDTVHKRITHTILVATSATFFTSATTTIAFLANAVSEVCVYIYMYCTERKTCVLL